MILSRKATPVVYATRDDFRGQKKDHASYRKRGINRRADFSFTSLLCHPLGSADRSHRHISFLCDKSKMDSPCTGVENRIQLFEINYKRQFLKVNAEWDENHMEGSVISRYTAGMGIVREGCQHFVRSPFLIKGQP